jgi:hypothetical protein
MPVASQEVGQRSVATRRGRLRSRGLRIPGAADRGGSGTPAVRVGCCRETQGVRVRVGIPAVAAPVVLYLVFFVYYAVFID